MNQNNSCSLLQLRKLSTFLTLSEARLQCIPGFRIIFILTLLPMGGGGFLSHTTILSVATLKPLKLWLPNFVAFCFTFLPQFEKFKQNRSARGVATVIFQTRGHEKLSRAAVVHILRCCTYFAWIAHFRERGNGC